MQTKSYLVTLLTTSFICVITFVYCEEENQLKETAEEEDVRILQDAISEYGSPQPPEKYGLPGPEVKYGDEKSSKENLLDGNLGNFTHRYRIMSEYYSFNGHYEIMEENIVDGKKTVKIRGQVCEEIPRKYGGYYLRTLGYIFDNNKLQKFLIDVTKIQRI